MKEPGIKTKIFIKPYGNRLTIKLQYPEQVSEEDFEEVKKTYQAKFSAALGKTIPKEKIKVKPQKGEIIERITVFTVIKGKSLPPGAQLLPVYLKQLIIEKLKKTKRQSGVVQFAIRGLE